MAATRQNIKTIGDLRRKIRDTQITLIVVSAMGFATEDTMWVEVSKAAALRAVDEAPAAGLCSAWFHTDEQDTLYIG